MEMKECNSIDVNSRSKVELTAILVTYLIKNNKITAEEQDTDKLEKLCFIYRYVCICMYITKQNMIL